MYIKTEIDYDAPLIAHYYQVKLIDSEFSVTLNPSIYHSENNLSSRLHAAYILKEYHDRKMQPVGNLLRHLRELKIYGFSIEIIIASIAIIFPDLHARYAPCLRRRARLEL